MNNGKGGGMRLSGPDATLVMVKQRLQGLLEAWDLISSETRVEELQTLARYLECVAEREREKVAEAEKVPPHKHQWMAIDQDWKPPVLTTFYRCMICGAERQAVEVTGADEPREEE
jgi:hypothetical protein